MKDIAHRVAKRYIESKESTWDEFERAVKAAVKVHDKFAKWVDGLPKVLRKAMEEADRMGLPDGRVPSKTINDYIHGRQGYDTITWKTMNPLLDRIERLGWDLGLDDYLTPITNGLTIGSPSTRDATSTMAIMDGAYTQSHDVDGKLVISLDAERVEKWGQTLKKWTHFWVPVMEKTLKSAKRSYKRKAKR